LATGVVELLGAKEIGSEWYKKVKVLYNNPYPDQIDKTYYVKGNVADGTTRYQLYEESSGSASATGIYVTVTEYPMITYSFTSYGDVSCNAAHKYADGTARNTGNFKKFDSKYYQQIVVVTNDVAEFVGKNFYVPADAKADGTPYRLRDNEGTEINVWVKITNP